MPDPHATTLQKAVDLALKPQGGLEAYLRAKRDARRSWRRISLDLRDELDLDVGPETLRGWFPDEAEAVAS